MSKEFKHIVRIAGVDLDGSLSVAYALSRIKGVGIRLAHAILNRLNIRSDARLGFLGESDVEKIENAILNIKDLDVPSWLLNRRKDMESGEDIHLIGSDLDLRIKSDIELMKAIKSWKGYRHAYGLKVRGQRTRTTGRTGKTIGVKKKRGGRR